MTDRAFEFRHIVGFEESNLVGNVYYVNHLRWQGRCREMFLREHCPEILDELKNGLALFTTQCSCQYFNELEPFDQIVVKMRLGEIVQNRVTMLFRYFRLREDSSEELVAQGEQQIACMRRENGRNVVTPVPKALRDALRPFA